MTAPELPPWATQVTAITAACSTCHEDISDDGDPVWFASPAEATRYVEDQDGTVDGDTLTCAACIAAAACEAAGGHDTTTVPAAGRPGMVWWCQREHCRAGGYIDADGSRDIT